MRIFCVSRILLYNFHYYEAMIYAHVLYYHKLLSILILTYMDLEPRKLKIDGDIKYDFDMRRYLY